jgi:hypothetical protein
MNAIFQLIFNILLWVVSAVIRRFGIKVAISAAAMSAWIGLIVSFTAAVTSCYASVCGLALNWGGLSEWARLGLSLVPSNAVLVITCIVSARAAGWFAVVLGRFLRTKASVAGVHRVAR